MYNRVKKFFNTKNAALVFATLCFANTAKADMFTLHLQQGNIEETRGFESVIDLFDRYEDGTLDSIISGYDDTKASFGQIDFRGIPMTLRFDDNAVLTFNVPDADIHNMTFDGGSQEESFQLLKDWLKNNKDGLMKKILKAGVEKTPYDMVAGNPNSLMATMTDNSFQRAGGGVLGNFVSYISPNASQHSFDFDGDTKKAKVYSLPLAKTFNFGNSGYALLFDMPLTYADMDGSVSYAAQLGLGLKIPVINNDKMSWNLIPAGRVGAIGSEDMLSGGILYSGTLTSDLQIPVGNFTYGLTNMVGYIRDYSLKVDDYEIEYDLQNTIFKNGVSVRWDFADKWALNGSYAYTFYSGSELFIDDYHDTGVALVRKFDKGSFFSGMALVGNYAFGSNDYQAYRLGINLLF